MEWSWRGSREENGERCWEITGQGDYDFRDTDLVAFLPQHREGSTSASPKAEFLSDGSSRGK